MRILFFGDAAWAARSLERLCEAGQSVAGVVLRARPTDEDLADTARRLGLPVFQPPRCNSPEFVDQVVKLAPDLNLSVSYDQIIRPPLLTVAPRGFLNVHAGKLPFYRGRSVINWAILNGETEIGLTVHFMDEGIDTGDILLQRTAPISWTDAYGDVLARVTAAIPALVADAVRLVESGDFTRRHQSHLEGSYFRRRGPGDEWIHWPDTSVNIYNKIRAISKPAPGACTIFEGRRMVVWRASYDPAWPKSSGSPGIVTEVVPGRGIRVATGDSTILLERVQFSEEAGEAQTPSFPVGSRLGAEKEEGMNIGGGDSEVETPVDHNFHQIYSERIARWEATRTPAYWEYRRKWEEYPKNHVAGEHPIHLDIEATTACNLRCTMCSRTELLATGAFWKIENIPFDLYTRLVDEGVRRGLCSIKYNFLGEPLINKRLVEMIEYAKTSGVIDVMFNTNATLLDDEMSRCLINSGLDKLFFSFDSPYPEQFNQIRAGADFHDVLGKIRRFMEIRGEMRSISPFTRVSMVRMKENKAVWDDFQALFAPIVDAVAYVDYLDHLGTSDPERMVIPAGTRHAKFCCPQLWQRAFVHPDGVVTICCMDARRELQIGNVFAQSIHEIWQGGAYERLRALHASGRFEEIPMCARCPLTRY